MPACPASDVMAAARAASFFTVGPRDCLPQ